MSFDSKEYPYYLVVKKVEKNGDGSMYNEFFKDAYEVSKYLKRMYGIDKELDLGNNYNLERNGVSYTLNLTFRISKK